jgi:chain length determinant protein EpsF
MSLHQFLLVLRARWRIAASIVTVVLVAAALVSVLSPKQYTATASVVIDAKSDPVGGPGAVLTEQMLQSYVTTQVDIITSQRVALRVVKALGLEQNPELQRTWREKWRWWTRWMSDGEGDIKNWMASYLLEKKLRVTPSRESNVIDLSVKWSDAKGAAELANAFAQAAIETNIELKVEPAKQYASWFEQRSRMLRADLEAKQKRLSDFQTATGIIATDEKLDVENARLTELSTQLVAIQGLRQDSQSRQRQVGTNNEALPEVLQSTLIADLKNDLSDAEAKRAETAARVGQNHPDYQAAEATVANLRLRIDQETAKIAASLGSTTQVNLQREGDIRLALEAQKKRVLELKHQHDEAAVLQNDVLTAQRDLDAVTQRLAQSNLESQTQQTNIVQLTFAVPPLQHSSPKLLLNLLLGLLFGGVLGVGTALLLEVRDPRVRDDSEMSQLLDVPLLGKIGYIRMGGRDDHLLIGDGSRLEQSLS